MRESEENRSAWGAFLDAVRGDVVRYGKRTGLAPTLYTFLFSAGFRFVLAHRLQRLVRVLPLVGRSLSKLWWAASCRRFSGEIAQSAAIGPGLYIPHPYGIVLGLCTIGRNVVVLQNVTIGKNGDTGIRGPIIADDVVIGAGSIVLGDVVVGEGAQIGANSLVLADVPAGAVAVGSPARVIGTVAGRAGT